MKSNILRMVALLFMVAILHDFAAAGVIMTEDFESYSTTAQMNAAWNEPATPGAGTLDTVNGHFGNSLFHPGGTTQKRTFTPTIATDANPIIWEFDLFDSNATNKRLTGGLRDNGGGNPLSAILEMGRFNSVFNPETSTIVDAYAIRTVSLGGPTDANGWLTFHNPNTNSFQPRVAGWNHFRAEIGATSINWSLDIGANGSYDAFRSTPLATGTNRSYNVARFGGPSDVTSAGGSVNFDNLMIRQAETVTVPWDVTVVGGPHNGSTGTGSFTYSDRSLDAHGTGLLNPTNGNLSLSLSVLGQTFDQTHDQGYNSSPNLYVQNFTPQYLDYNVDETSFFNPVPIYEPNVKAIHASNYVVPNGGGGYHQDIAVEEYPLPPIVLDNGSLKVSVSRNNGSINQVLFGGSDFYNRGTAVSDWGMQVDTDTNTFARNVTQLTGESSGIPVSVAAVGDAAVVTGTYAPGGGVQIGVTRTYSLVPGQNVLRITMEFTNHGADVTIAGFDTFDPDQGYDHGNLFSTFNDVSSANDGSAKFAEATDLDGLSVVMGSLDSLATIASGYPFAIASGFDLNDFFAVPYDGNGTFDDSGTHVGIRRFLASGGSFSFTYDQAYGLTASDALNEFTAANVPEPSTLIIAAIATLGLAHWPRRKRFVLA